MRWWCVLVACLVGHAAGGRKKKQRSMEDKIDNYKKSELSESKDLCKQCEFVVARLSSHLLDTSEALPTREQWLKRMPRYCEPMNTPSCLRFLKIYGGILSDDLADLSADARDLGENEPSLSNEALRQRLCDDVTESCQSHHNVIRSNDVALEVRNSLKTKARVFWMRQDPDTQIWTAVVPEAMQADHVVLPGARVRIQAKRGQQFALLPEGIQDEGDAPRLLVRHDGPKTQIFDLRQNNHQGYDLLYLSGKKDNNNKKQEKIQSSGGGGSDKDNNKTTTSSEL